MLNKIPTLCIKVMPYRKCSKKLYSSDSVVFVYSCEGLSPKWRRVQLSDAPLLLLLCFAVFIVFYVGFAMIRKCEGYSPGQQNCSDNFLLQPTFVQDYLSQEQIFTKNSKLFQNDILLLNYIRKNHIILPPSDVPTGSPPQRGQAEDGEGVIKFVRTVLNYKPGFFVEARVHDWTKSKTLRLESDWHWKGLLLEPNPEAFSQLRKSRRNSSSVLSNACMSTTGKPEEIIEAEFRSSSTSLIDTGNRSSMPEESVLEENVLKCFPLFSILSAVNATNIDFMILDAGGAELKVLRTVPFDSVHIKIFSIPHISESEGRTSLVQFLVSKGYRLVHKMNYGGKKNFIFVHYSIL